jgi:invasion protein IalB
MIRPCILLCCFLLASGGAQAQQRTTAIYGDWTLSCVIAAGGGKSCGLVQSQKTASQSFSASKIGIGRIAKNDPLKISVEIGADVWIPTNVQLITGDNVPILTATFKWCVSTRCLADAVLSDANIETLRSQKSPGMLAYKTASQADVPIPILFNGFGEALDALQKQ